MTARLALAAMTLAMIGLPALADEAAKRPLPTVNVNAGPHLVIDCGAAKMPSFRDVAAVLDSNNSGQIYRERDLLLDTARRECARGFKEIVFVRELVVGTPALAVADVSAR